MNNPLRELLIAYFVIVLVPLCLAVLGSFTAYAFGGGTMAMVSVFTTALIVAMVLYTTLYTIGKFIEAKRVGSILTHPQSR